MGVERYLWRWYSTDGADAAAEDLVFAAWCADEEDGNPRFLGEVRRRVREVISAMDGLDPTGLPAWAVAPVADETVDLVNSWRALDTWAAREDSSERIGNNRSGQHPGRLEHVDAPLPRCCGARFPGTGHHRRLAIAVLGVLTEGDEPSEQVFEAARMASAAANERDRKRAMRALQSLSSGLGNGLGGGAVQRVADILNAPHVNSD